MVGPGRPQFVLFGSSIVQFSYSNQGWGATLADLYARKADILLRGYSGWNSRRAVEVLDKVFPKDAAIQPSLVIVYFGGKRLDAATLKWTRTSRASPRSLSEETRIIFLSAPPVNEEKIRETLSDVFTDLGRTNEACRLYSDACLELCREMDVKAIDLWTAIQKRDDWRSVCFTDGIHLSAEGSEVVVAEILKVLREAEWEPSLHWQAMPTEFAEDSPYDPVGPDGKSTKNVADWEFHRTVQWI